LRFFPDTREQLLAGAGLRRRNANDHTEVSTRTFTRPCAASCSRISDRIRSCRIQTRWLAA
jgi:hypothetical protein